MLKLARPSKSQAEIESKSTTLKVRDSSTALGMTNVAGPRRRTHELLLFSIQLEVDFDVVVFAFDEAGRRCVHFSYTFGDRGDRFVHHSVLRRMRASKREFA